MPYAVTNFMDENGKKSNIKYVHSIYAILLVGFE